MKKIIFLKKRTQVTDSTLLTHPTHTNTILITILLIGPFVTFPSQDKVTMK